jgi:hypothetical protein
MGNTKMQNVVRSGLLLAAVSGVLTVSATRAKADAEYTITNLGIGSGQPFGNTTASSINNNGEVVINSSANPVLYNGGYTPVSPAGSTLSQVNDSGLAVGYTSSSQAGYTTASSPTLNTSLGTLTGGGATMALGVNPTGSYGSATIVGTAINSIGRNQAVTWTGPSGTISALSPSNSSAWDITSDNAFSEALAINSGLIVGQATTNTDSPDAFITNGTAFKDIAPAGSVESVAEAVNSSGFAVGNSTPDDVNQFAFVYSPADGGITTLLPTLGGTIYESDASSINASGLIVGQSDAADDSNIHAVLYTTSGGIIDLNDEIATGSGWVLEDATSINDNGDIVGYGTYDDGIDGPVQDAFLLTPASVPEPTSAALVMGAGLFLLGRRRRVN